MVLILSVLIGVTLGFTGAKPAEAGVKYYATKYDHIDVETILNNRRMVNYYAACLLSRGPCPPEGVEFKRILPEALQTNCGRCTEKQATVAYRAIKRIRKEYPKIWTQLSEKWDPDESHVKKFESTFKLRNGQTNSPIIPNPAVLSSYGADDDTTSNNIGGSLFSTTTTSHQDPTTRRFIPSTNSIPLSSTIRTTTTYPYPSYEPTSLVSTAKTTTKPSSPSIPIALSSTTTRPSTTSRLSTTTSSPSTTPPTIRTTIRPQTIPGLLPFNTFFTNPPIPVRPLINLNIGANIGATVSGLVRGLGALGTRVMETGADIAEVVIKNFARPLRV